MTLRRLYVHECLTCGKPFRPDRRSSKYCGRSCSAIGHIKPVLTCEQCGKPIVVARRQADRRFCGRACAAVAATKERPTCHVCGVRVTRGSIACNRHRHAAKRIARARDCEVCGKSFVPYPSQPSRYCSLPCWRQVAGLRPALVALECAQCGKTFRRTQAAVKRVVRSFCSLACATTYNSGSNNVSWRGGSDPNRGSGWARIAESVRVRDGLRCRRCGKTQEEEGQKLSVDHVIPWRSFELEAEANDPSNLVALCRSCHAKKGRAERQWLKGDVLEMWGYQVAVSAPWNTDKRNRERVREYLASVEPTEPVA